MRKRTRETEAERKREKKIEKGQDRNRCIERQQAEKIKKTKGLRRWKEKGPRTCQIQLEAMQTYPLFWPCPGLLVDSHWHVSETHLSPSPAY